MRILTISDFASRYLIACDALSTTKEIYAVGLPKWQGWAKAARAKLEQMTANLHFPMPSTSTSEVVA
jgi:hypothetical protein